MGADNVGVPAPRGLPRGYAPVAAALPGNPAAERRPQPPGTTWVGVPPRLPVQLTVNGPHGIVARFFMFILEVQAKCRITHSSRKV